jgi:uncharacterized membrane protein YhhN
MYLYVAYAAASLVMTAAAPYALDPRLHSVIRGLPVGLLAVAALAGYARGDRRAVRLFVALGLVASAAGDVLLPLVFLAGIGAFLGAHVLYIAALGLPRPRPGLQALALVPAAALWAVMYAVVTPRVPAELYGPVVVYLSVITLMLARALGRLLAARSAPAAWMLAGAACFVASDGLLALNRWVNAIPHEHVWVLGTYLAAQACIYRSVSGYRSIGVEHG